MTATPFDYATVTCPMPECAAGLHLTWTLRRPVLAGDINANYHSLPATDDAYTATWQVNCEDGHVVLIPGDPACPCGDDDCDHEDFDASDDLRTFRPHDLDRLRAVLDALNVKAVAQ